MFMQRKFEINKKKRKESIVTDKRRILFIFHFLIFNKTKYFILTDSQSLTYYIINQKKRTKIYVISGLNLLV